MANSHEFMISKVTAYLSALPHYAIGLLYIEDIITYHWLFGLVFLEIIINGISVARDKHLKRKEKILSFIEKGLTITVLILGIMKTQDINLIMYPPSIVALVVVSVAFIIIPKEYRPICLRKLIFWTQILLISFKLDGILTKNWNEVFLVLKIALGILLSCSVVFFFSVIRSISQKLCCP